VEDASSLKKVRTGMNGDGSGIDSDRMAQMGATSDKRLKRKRKEELELQEHEGAAGTRSEWCRV
jgi:hypothetical protein